MKYLALTGRILFSLIFLTSAFGHFMPSTIQFVASKGLPMASILVPLSGVVEMLGAFSILFGYKTKWGAALIILFLIPVTVVMHSFWNISDPMMRQMDMANFMKNMALVGAAILIANFGAGPLSLDARRKKSTLV